jgi:catechol 2,3-dioxygenase-like lactoylglutathione lyase family enzyme
MSVFGLSHIDVPVTNLERSEQLFTQHLGFSCKQRGEGWADIDTGTCLLRLLKTRQVEHRVTLRIQVGDVAETTKLLRDAGMKVIYEPLRTAEQELMAQLVDGDGHSLIVWRELTEDEYEQIPELPKELSWQADAEELLKSLLRSVPALFRALVRWRVAKNAEQLAAATRVVTREQVIRSFILSSAKVTRSRVRQPLIDHGVDLERYAEDFAAEERL